MLGNEEVAMVTGKPPRRSKSSDDPVTIDLPAEETGTSAAEAAPDPADATPEPEPIPTETVSIGTDTTETHEEAHPSEPAIIPETEEARAKAMPPLREPPRQPVRQSPTTSTLIASGIFGGLVALALAGGMQYAGVIPGIGPEEKQAAAPADDSELQALKAEVARLVSMQATAPATDSTLADRIAALETAAQVQVPAAPADTAALDELRAQITLSNDAIAALRSELATNAETLSQSQARLAEAEKKIEEPRNDVEMARAIALAGLKAAIDRGGPFISELDALKSVAPDDAAVQSLAPIAAAGILSRADIARGFSKTADAILAAINQPDPNMGITDRLLSGALSVIKVRPVGNVEGETPEAIVARIENKLQNGDLKGAALEWDTLPEVGKAASADFAAMLGKRVEVEATIGEALTKTVGGTGG
jgi:hypothetical protein